jgi:methylenetetrahydrofolate--tRNA-(uracil-5-)-methyltransferase
MAGALIHFIAAAPPGEGRRGGFQPMPPNFGLLPELPVRIREKRLRYGAYRDRALADLEATRSRAAGETARGSLALAGSPLGMGL